MNALTNFNSLAPATIDEALRFSDMLAQSSMVPKDYRGQPGNIFVAIQWGMEIGLPPMQAMQNIAVINGRPSIWGDAMLALAKGHPAWEWIKEDCDGTTATCTVKRRGEPEVVQTFSLEDAKRAGLAGKDGPWKQYPQRMLQMRARSWALRDAFPDALKGIRSTEELRDEPAERDMGAAEVVDAPKHTSRTEQVKAALSKPKAPEIDMAEVMAAISRASNAEGMKHAAKLADRLSDSSEKTAARHAYAERLRALKEAETAQAEPAGVDPDDEFLRGLEQGSAA